MIILNKRHLAFIALVTLIGTSQVSHASNCVKPRVTGYQYIGCLHDGLAGVVTKDSKLGFVNHAGKLVIPAIYEADFSEDGEVTIKNFSEGLVVVNKLAETANGFGQVYGVLNTEGKTVIPFQYNWIGTFSEGLAPAQKDSKWGYIDKTGKVVISLTSNYTRGGIFSEGLAPVYSYVGDNSDNSKFGYIDKTGKLLIPMKFSQPFGGIFDDREHSFKNGKARVLDFKDNAFCINKIGTKVSCK